MTIYSIPATESFAYSLAEFSEALAKTNRIPLSSIKIYLPTRRGIRTLQEAFLNLSNGKPRLLPIMQSIGDASLEEASFANISQTDFPPAIDPMRRQLILAQLLEKAWPHEYNYQQALIIAAELGTLIDQIHTEDLDPANLENLIEIDDFAEHWEITTAFLQLILNELWPKYLASEAMIDPGLHRKLRINALTDYYKNNPSNNPVIVAGSTGSIPATRSFIKTVASLDNGLAILPALDTVMDDKSWHDIEEGHPQYLLKILLKFCNVNRENVQNIKTEKSDDARLKLAAEMMRPAESTHEWQALSDPDAAGYIINGLNGITVCEADNDHQEATTIALSMLEIAADPEKLKTATLITPDRYLAMRVQSILRQWGIDIDDSGGTTLTNTTIGQFCISCLNSLQDNQVQPVAFLTCMKNSYAGDGHIANFRNTIRTVEKAIFRSVRPHGNFLDISKLNESYQTFFTVMHDLFGSLNDVQKGKHNLIKLVTAHLKVMENIALTNDKSGAERLWSGDDGEALAQFFTSLQAHADVTPDITLKEYSEIIKSFISKQTFNKPYGTHPRLSILGQIEARMVHADRVILSGLNEGIWPPDTGFDTWMSRPMRLKFGLPSLEQKTTLAAHDFMTAFCAPEVFITRSKKTGGQPTLPSRWLDRLRTVLLAAAIPLDNWPHARGLIYTHWAKTLIEVKDYKPITRPDPTPVLERRPCNFSVTEIEKWMRDPYWIYAKKILKLRKLDPVDMEVGAADRGTLIHNTMEKFTKTFPNRNLPDNALEKLLHIGKQEFNSHALDPEIHGFWWPRFTKAANWFINHEAEWRLQTSAIVSESEGSLTCMVKGSLYTLKGKADRIESRLDNTYAIIDYKTGSAPSSKDVNSGISSQLALETMILEDFGFSSISYRPDTEKSLYYWSLSGTGDGGLCKLAQGEKGSDTSQLIAEARSGLQSLFESFHNSTTPFLGSPDPSRTIKFEYNDYAHLERISEWSIAAEDGEAA